MEKICIARRMTNPPLELRRPERQSVVQPVEDAFLRLVPEEYVPKSSQRAVSMELTHEQAVAFRSGIDLAPGRTCMLYLETKRQDNGRVIFNFSLAPLYGGKMLCSKEVCKMLEISRSFLYKMVRTRQIDSYKIGRLRRFLLEDVLHYLSSSRELY